MKYYCVDCDIEITDKNKGARYSKKNGIDRYKCIDCYEIEPDIKQECEVYSRVVGYLRPVKQWNKGKISEYERRKVFKV